MRYSKLPSDFWNSKSGRAVRACGPVALQVYLYLRSCEMGNYVGFFRLNAGHAALDLGIQENTLVEYIEKFGEVGLVMYDSEAEVLWIIDQAEVQVGELKMGDKQIIGINKNIGAIERSPIRDAFYNKYHQLLKLHANLAPLPAAVESVPETNRAILTSAEQSRVALQDASANGRFEGVLSALLVIREANRQTYSEVRDLCVQEDAEAIRQKVGTRRATDLIRNAIITGDLSLAKAMAAVSGSTC